MATDLRFLPDIPGGMRIWVTDVEVAGIQHRLSAARAFAKGRSHELLLEREPRNRHDTNAIKVIGVYEGWFFTHSVHIGYVPADIAKLVADRGDFDQLRPRLKNIWWGGYVRDFIVVRFDILEPKPSRKELLLKGKERKTTAGLPCQESQVSELTSLERRTRHVSWLLQSVHIRQTARKAFDLTRLGNGPAERLCSALILGAVFFFVVLLLAHLAKLKTAYALGAAGVAIVSVMASSGVLVLWKSDVDLKKEGSRLSKELADLRYAVFEARAEREAEEVLQVAEREAEETERESEEAARPRRTATRCPFCREVIRKRALKCKHCGEILDEDLRAEHRPHPQQRWNPGVAAVLSFFWPGLGQIYKSQILNGFAWMFLVLLGYACCVLPGFFLHVCCIFGAASGSED